MCRKKFCLDTAKENPTIRFLLNLNEWLEQTDMKKHCRSLLTSLSDLWTLSFWNLTLCSYIYDVILHLVCEDAFKNVPWKQTPQKCQIAKANCTPLYWLLLWPCATGVFCFLWDCSLLLIFINVFFHVFLCLLYLSPVSQVRSKGTTSFQMRSPPFSLRLRFEEGGWHFIHQTPLIMHILKKL